MSIDVGELVQRSVASLYSHLVTRPTGRAVRLAIESQLAEGSGRIALSLVDLSEVRILDFSCADEVVAKLLLRYQRESRPQDAFFVFLGVEEPHRDPIEVVLKRQSLAAVAETGAGRFELLGTRTDDEARIWRVVEDERWVGPDESRRVFSEPAERRTLQRLVRRRLVFRESPEGGYRALSALIQGVP